MVDPLLEKMYRALVTHGGHTHGVHQPQDCPTCEAKQAYELRKLAEQELKAKTNTGPGKGEMEEAK